MACIGILGGSFNPPHRGHLALARRVMDEGMVDGVWLIPAATPPHKPNPAETPAMRLAMTRLLAGEDHRLAVDDLELHRTGPSFTVDTLHELIRLHPENRYRLVIGSDQAKAFASWRNFTTILELAPPLIAERPDFLFSGCGDYSGLSPDQVAVMEAGRFAMPYVDVSSTRVRELVRAGAGDASLLPLITSPILEYIREYGLYREACSCEQRQFANRSIDSV